MHLLALLLNRLEICQEPFHSHSCPPPASVSCSALGHSLSLCSLARDLRALWQWFAMTWALAGKGPQPGNERWCWYLPSVLPGWTCQPMFMTPGPLVLRGCCNFPQGAWFLPRDILCCVICLLSIMWVQVKVAKSCLTLSTPWTIQSMEFSRPEYGVGSLSLPQGIFPIQGWKPGLPHCRRILYQLSHQGSLTMWEADPTLCSYLSDPVPCSADGGFFTPRLHQPAPYIPSQVPPNMSLAQ